MDQIYQLQQQIQKVRQEVNNISQLTSQLHQFGQQLSSDLNNMNSTTQQISQNMGQKMYQPQSGYAGQSGYNQQFGTFGTQFTPGGSTGLNPRFGYSTNMQNQPMQNINTPFQQQRFATGQWAGNYYTPMQSGYGSPAQDYSQSYAQNQQISQQAQQALDSRMNRATQNMFGQGNQMHSYTSGF